MRLNSIKGEQRFEEVCSRVVLIKEFIFIVLVQLPHGG